MIKLLTVQKILDEEHVQKLRLISPKEAVVGQWDNLFAFRDAAMRDDLAAMRDVLARDSSFLADENPDDLPLEYLAKVYQMQTCAREGPLDKVRALADADPRLLRQPWTRQRWRPLHQAICGDQHAIFDLLVERGADLNDRYDEGGTVLHMAAWDGRVAFAEKILALGFPVDARDDNGKTAAQIAEERGHQGCAEFLRSRGG